MMWNLTKYSSNIAIITDSAEVITYQDLDDAALQLKERIPGRCLVFSFCTNQKGSLLGYVTFLNNQIVPVLIDAQLNQDLLSRLLDTYKPEYLWLPKSQASNYHEKIEFEIWDYVLVRTSYDLSHPLHADLALLLTTSGSTGSPKLVRQSYQNIRCNTESIVEYLGIDSSERPITTLPMSYTYGLSIINTHLYVGASIILTQKSIMEREFWHQFKEYQATSFGGVPYTYEMLEKLRFFRINLPSLRTMTQAGGKLSPELHLKFAEYAKNHAKRFIVMYGQTEATARMSYLPPEKSIEKYGSMGIAIPGGKLKLINEFGDEIDGTDKTGELLYEGDNVTLGYAESGEDLIKGDERKGVLHTGDMAKRDSDGYYYIVGRKKRFLKIFGSRVNLDETERLIKSTFDYLECACCGLDDKMYVFITDDSKVDSVKNYLVDITNFHPVAFNVKTINQIPKNESGKTQYLELEKYYD